MRPVLWLVVLFAAIFLIPAAVHLFERIQSGSGIRSGVIVQLTYRGRFNRSWEGELMLGSVQSGQTWSFSLDPSNPTTPSIAKKLQAAELSRVPVTLRYQQRFIGPWRTDTNCLVSGVALASSPMP